MKTFSIISVILFLTAACTKQNEPVEDFNKLPAPSMLHNFYYLPDKYVINIQSYREFDNLILFDLPDIDLFKDPELKSKIGQIDEDGILLNAKRICKYGPYATIDYLKTTSSYYRKIKNGKHISYRWCSSLAEESHDFRFISFAENNLPQMREIHDEVNKGELPDGHYTVNFLASEVKGSVAKIETQANGSFYLDLNDLKKFKLQISLKLQEYIKRHPLGKELIVALKKNGGKYKILGHENYEPGINISHHKLFDQDNEALCFEEILDKYRDNRGRWCYYKQHLCTNNEGGTTGVLTIENCKRIVSRHINKDLQKK